ncbi:hypothetical protein K0M31_004383 [Melipona bicolor]|uniref:Uncharacterized protein n=1 Tax=Melipona bicolor TaxID=60889 RepID=A0AA40FXB2_9HYME|nr:hypothetical protein K0M31_004383 [Melipona bicolor]
MLPEKRNSRLESSKLNRHTRFTRVEREEPAAVVASASVKPHKPQKPQTILPFFLFSFPNARRNHLRINKGNERILSANEACAVPGSRQRLGQGGCPKLRPCEAKRELERRVLPGSLVLCSSPISIVWPAARGGGATMTRWNTGESLPRLGCLLFTNNHSRQASKQASKQASRQASGGTRANEPVSHPASQRRSKRVERQASKQAANQQASRQAGKACTGRPLARIYSGETSSKDQRGQVGRRREGPGLSRPRPSADTERGGDGKRLETVNHRPTLSPGSGEELVPRR